MTTRPPLALAALVIAVLATSALTAGQAEARGPHGGKLAEHFSEIDTDHDGRLTSTEMRAFQAARFAAADVDGDGRLTLEEMDNLRKTERLARLKPMMTWMDADGDGLIALSELPMPGLKMMARLDVDGDGAISSEELEASKSHKKRHHDGRH